MDGVFRALADPGRRRLLDSLNARNGQTLRELCADMDMARQSVSKHLAVLEDANLVTTVWRGREKLHYLNAAPINDISERWINRYEQPRVDALTDLKQPWRTPRWTSPHSSTRRTSRPRPERLWEALTSSGVHRALLERRASRPTGRPARRWSGTTAACGSPTRSRSCSRPTRYRRLSYTWHTFTPELAQSRGGERGGLRRRRGRAPVQGDLRARAGGQRGEADRHPRRVPAGEHGGRAVGNGWPRVLSRLKTLLETGETFRIETAPPTTTRPTPDSDDETQPMEEH